MLPALHPGITSADSALAVLDRPHEHLPMALRSVTRDMNGHQSFLYSLLLLLGQRLGSSGADDAMPALRGSMHSREVGRARAST